MKYIRTKDGIHKHIENSENDLWFKKYVIKQADTIEELCDEFVVIIDKEPNGYLIFNQCMNNFEKVISIHKNTKNENTIYGAIWTDKGLIYVAKMNEKGELELL